LKRHFALRLFDGAGWCQKISCYAGSAFAPELNGREYLGEHLRSNWLSVSDNYEEHNFLASAKQNLALGRAASFAFGR
jgi:hypothetical protein